MKRLKLLFILLLGATTLQAQSFPPVNPKATPEARQLLEFLYSLQGKRTLTGQHNHVSDMALYDDAVYEMTGKYAAVWGCDFSFNAVGADAWKYQHAGPMNLTPPLQKCEFNGRSASESRQMMIDEAIKKYQEGRIITLMWHCCWPTDGADDCDGASVWSWDNRPDAKQWEELVTDGTPLNEAWKKQVDVIAAYLKQLQEAHVPVIWRPYHEMNGVWFWWCDKPGEWGFKRLWVMMYDYLTNHHKLNNLLWAWNTNAPRDIPGDEAGPYKYFYPGAEYVDILATDVYRRDYRRSHHDDLFLLSKGKLISLGEVGELPTVGQYTSQPNWSWFMVWGWCIKYWNDLDNVKTIYHHPQSVTLDQIDFAGQTYKLRKP